MITLITTWVTEKIVAVFTVTLVAVAAVPTTLVLTTEHQVTVTLQQQQQQQQIVLVKTVKKAGDDLIVKLQSAEASCNTQVTTVVTTAKIDPGRVQSQLAQSKTQIHGSVAPIIAAINRDEDTFAHLTLVTPEDEENELEHLQQLTIVSLGDGKTITGTVTVTCQIVVVEIQVIVVEIERHGFDD